MALNNFTISMKWKIFKDFLVQENALKSYLDQYDPNFSALKDSQCTGLDRPSIIEFLPVLDLRSSCLLRRWIINSMDFDKTKEGFGFWSNLNDKFYEYCRNFESRYSNTIDLEKYRKTIPYGQLS